MEVFLPLYHMDMANDQKKVSRFTRLTERNKKIFSNVVTVLILVVVIAVIVLFASRSPGSQNVIHLSGIEITWYKWEKLSSISDFIENSIKGPQYININKYKLKIDGLVDKKLSLAYNAVLSHTGYSKVVTLNCVEGWSVKILWQGVLLKDLLNEAGIQSWSNTVIFYAYDGYSSSLPLQYIMDNNILLAYKMNGVVIPPARGFPFMVVAENKWWYKWVKWVTEIKVSNDPTFKGYWERAWYNQTGDLTWPIIGN